MYENQITDFEKPYQFSNCPNCGLFLEMMPLRLSNFKEGLGEIQQGGRHCSYRRLICKNDHMFIVIGKYVRTFSFPNEEEYILTRFEIKCDEDMDWQMLRRAHGGFVKRYPNQHFDISIYKANYEASARRNRD
jgi:hypothetical protein